MNLQGQKLKSTGFAYEVRAFGDGGRAQAPHIGTRGYPDSRKTLSLLWEWFLPCTNQTLSTNTSHLQSHQLPWEFHTTPPSIFSCSSQKEGSFLPADHHPELGTPAHIHGALRHPPAVERPHGAWHKRQYGSSARPALCPLYPPLGHQQSLPLIGLQAEVVPSSAIRGYSASSALITVSSSLITVVMIGLWPVNSFKETSHYRRGREILLWV